MGDNILVKSEAYQEIPLTDHVSMLKSDTRWVEECLLKSKQIFKEFQLWCHRNALGNAFQSAVFGNSLKLLS